MPVFATEIPGSRHLLEPVTWSYSQIAEDRQEGSPCQSCTLQTLDILTQKGGFDPRAARAIGEAIDLEIARSRDVSATREDLNECRRTLSDEIGALRVETDRSISTLRAELGAVRAELKEDIGSLRTELKGDINELRVQVQAVKAALVRWVFVAITGQTAILLGVVYFFMRYLK